MLYVFLTSYLYCKEFASLRFRNELAILDSSPFHSMKGKFLDPCFSDLNSRLTLQFKNKIFKFFTCELLFVIGDEDQGYAESTKYASLVKEYFPVSVDFRCGLYFCPLSEMVNYNLHVMLLVFDFWKGSYYVNSLLEERPWVADCRLSFSW